MSISTAVVLPFPAEQCGGLPRFAGRPFGRDGLVFGIAASVNGDAAAFANVSGHRRVWAAVDRPWGRLNESALWLAGEAVQAIRPDWRESFWSREFLATVTHDFCEVFLTKAPWEGGVIPLSDIRAWMRSRQIGCPEWDFLPSVRPVNAWF